jgi:hypothetical protein
MPDKAEMGDIAQCLWLAHFEPVSIAAWGRSRVFNSLLGTAFGHPGNRSFAKSFANRDFRDDPVYREESSDQGGL